MELQVLDQALHRFIRFVTSKNGIAIDRDDIGSFGNVCNIASPGHDRNGSVENILAIFCKVWNFFRGQIGRGVTCGLEAVGGIGVLSDVGGFVDVADSRPLPCLELTLVTYR